MKELNIKRSIHLGRLSFDGMFLFHVVDIMYYTVVQGLLSGVPVIFMLVLIDYWPNYLVQIYTLSVFIVGGINYWKNINLAESCYTNKDLKSKIGDYFRDNGWVVMKHNKHHFHATKTTLGKSYSDVFVIFKNSNVLVSAVIGWPSPFCNIISNRIKKDIASLAK